MEVGVLALELFPSWPKQGARVAFTYTSQPDKAKKLLEDLPGEGHSIFKMDISDEASVKGTMTEILSDFNSLNGLVNNAGITSDHILLRMKTEDFDRVIQTNLRRNLFMHPICPQTHDPSKTRFYC